MKLSLCGPDTYPGSGYKMRIKLLLVVFGQYSTALVLHSNPLSKIITLRNSLMSFSVEQLGPNEAEAILEDFAIAACQATHFQLLGFFIDFCLVVIRDVASNLVTGKSLQ